MAIFKCKMCGGDLEIAEGISIVECEYCGTKQTVPKAMDENMQNIFNRANTLRIKSEFDKAEKLYEKIIQSDTTQAEAYWGLILCKYGIEYVDDPATFKKIPTCHRASYDSVISDDDYKSAIENADISQRTVYEEQAKEIDRIQKEILALAQKEETYDVFICYKETDANGQRTHDSVIANDIYHQLTQEGFKVFYAAITLEGKLGAAYEPIIFAALNSAKVMLAIGTKPEYFNAVWVKNEWSRFLKIIKKDRSKLLIPCYRDMDAYELPEEFAHLQAQDMGKIGFINDVVRGIKKTITKDTPKQTVVKETVISGGNANTAPLLKRAFMFLEDGDWNSANEYCEKVLDIDPECAMAYLGKLMASLGVRKQEDLKNFNAPFDNDNNFQKAIRFADNELKATLNGYITHINTRNENARLEGLYSQATYTLNNAKSDAELEAAWKIFASIKGYKDADEMAEKCDNQKKELYYKKALFEMDSLQFQKAKAIFLSIKDYKDADEMAEKCDLKSKELAYTNALGMLKSANSEGDFDNARKTFLAIKDYKDAAEMAEKCIEAQNDFIYNNAVRQMSLTPSVTVYCKNAIKKFERLNGWRDSEEKIKECEAIILKIEEAERKKAKKKKVITISIILAVIIAVVVFFVVKKVIIPSGKYNDAVALMNDGKYEEAIAAFEALGQYKDSDSKISECITANLDEKYNNAVALMNDGKYEEAITAFEALGGYKDSEERAISAYNKFTQEKLKNVKVGDVIYFGSYEQDNITTNGAEFIEWEVLEVQGGKALIISKYALDCKKYNETYTYVTWETCTLRSWLNNDFYNTAFSAADKTRIQNTTPTNADNPYYGTDGGNNTTDKVFLLSIDEAIKYYAPDQIGTEWTSWSKSTNGAAKCEATAYAKANGAYVDSNYGTSVWWLRSPGTHQKYAACVLADGGVHSNGNSVNCNYDVVRPALWISLE